MIKFKDATQLQKKIVSSILKSILMMANCAANYRILQDSEDLMIRESTGNPPPERRQLRLLFLLTQNPLIKIKFGKIRVPGHLGHVSIPTFFIREINDTVINKIIAKITKSTVKKPDDIDDLIWSNLPDEITKRWDRFSTALQKHIIECVTADLPNLLAQVPDQKQADIGITYLSPVGLSAPSLPVRLPAPKKLEAEATSTAGSTAEPKAVVLDAKAEVNKVYDLLEILAIKERDPSDESRRRHPITREYFSLQDVLPAQDALLELKKRAEKALDEKEALASKASSGTSSLSQNSHRS